MSFKLSTKKRKHSSSDDEDSFPESPTKKNNSISYDDDEDIEEIPDSDTMSPPIMMTLVQELIQYIRDHDKEQTTVRSMQKVAEEFLISLPQDEDVDKFMKSYKKYLGLAQKQMSLRTSCDAIIEFLNKGETVKMFPGFPKAPPSLLMYYGKKHNLSVGIGRLTQVKERMEKDFRGRMECEREHHLMEEKFYKDLESFAKDSDPHFTPSQRKYLGGKIKSLHKKIYGPSIRTPKTPGPRSRKPVVEQHLTAFDYYKRTVPDKYSDLEPDIRNRKLMKKFNKLDEATREIFEKIAMR